MKGAGGPISLYVEDDRQQRAATILRDVAYVIEARFDLLDDSEPVAKHYNMFKRRAESGQCWQRPYMGTREFACDFEWLEGPPPAPHSSLLGTIELGYMLHDIVFSPTMEKQYDTIDGHTGRPLVATPRFFRARMVDGVIDVPSLAATETVG